LLVQASERTWPISRVLLIRLFGLGSPIGSKPRLVNI
jgi:hypothetical protein